MEAAVPRRRQGLPLLLLLLASSLAIAGCAGSDGDRRDTDAGGATLGTETDAPAGTVPKAAERYANGVKPCTAGEVRALVVSFVRSFNRGDVKRLDRIFAQEPDFEWYSANAPGQRLHAAARRRATLGRYFVRRHAQGEWLELRSFEFKGNTSTASPYGNFEVELVRRARNLRPTPWVAKGAVRCHQGADQILAWSM